MNYSKKSRISSIPKNLIKWHVENYVFDRRGGIDYHWAVGIDLKGLNYNGTWNQYTGIEGISTYIRKGTIKKGQYEKLRRERGSKSSQEETRSKHRRPNNPGAKKVSRSKGYTSKRGRWHPLKREDRFSHQILFL